MKPRTLARRLREAQLHLTDGLGTNGRHSFICHAIQLGVYGEDGEAPFTSNPALPEIAALVEMDMPLHAFAFPADEFSWNGSASQGARFMLLELAALLAEEGFFEQSAIPSIGGLK